MATQQIVQVATVPIATDPIATDPVAARYADLADRVLAAALSGEDIAEETDELNPLERITCRLHRRWLHHCVSSPAHVIAVTGHRWCRSCECAANVAIDELTADVRLTCPRCGSTPHGPATRQIVRCCRASDAAAAAHRGV